MRDFLLRDDGRDELGNILTACLVAVAVLIAFRAFDPVLAVIRQIILTQLM